MFSGTCCPLTPLTVDSHRCTPSAHPPRGPPWSGFTQGNAQQKPDILVRVDYTPLTSRSPKNWAHAHMESITSSRPSRNQIRGAHLGSQSSTGDMGWQVRRKTPTPHLAIEIVTRHTPLPHRRQKRRDRETSRCRSLRPWCSLEKHIHWSKEAAWSSGKWGHIS
jgi:hypothetical protein